MTTATASRLANDSLAREFGKPYDSVYGWARNGVAGHKLKVQRIAGRLYARPSWIGQFLADVERECS